MPTYEYACPDCGAQFERIQKFADKPVKKCPTCGRLKVHRLVGRIAVSFKGSGFYINDSKGSSGSSGTAVKDKEEPASATEAKDAKPAEVTTAATPESRDVKPVEVAATPAPEPAKA